MVIGCLRGGRTEPLGWRSVALVLRRWRSGVAGGCPEGGEGDHWGRQSVPYEVSGRSPEPRRRCPEGGRSVPRGSGDDAPGFGRGARSCGNELRKVSKDEGRKVGGVCNLARWARQSGNTPFSRESRLQRGIENLVYFALTACARSSLNSAEGYGGSLSAVEAEGAGVAGVAGEGCGGGEIGGDVAGSVGVAAYEERDSGGVG